MSETKELLLQCPRCGRSGFLLDGLRKHWCKSTNGGTLPAELVDDVIRKARKEADSMDKPWGYEVEICTHDGKIYTKKKQGTPAAVNRWARMQTLHSSHRIVATYTRAQWIRAYGDGRIRM